MILVDANLLVYAHAESLPQHERARTWLDEAVTTMPRVGLAWSSVLAFVRLVSNPRIFSEAKPIGHVWDQVERWLDQQSVWVPVPTTRHREVLGRCLAVPGLAAKDVPDAHLAALAIEHGLRLATSDSGFARFPCLTWFNPLQPAGGTPT